MASIETDHFPDCVIPKTKWFFASHVWNIMQNLKNDQGSSDLKHKTIAEYSKSDKSLTSGGSKGLAVVGLPLTSRRVLFFYVHKM